MLAFASPDPDFLAAWRRTLRPHGVPALTGWRYELRCTDDGEGVDADLIDRRLGALGVEPPRAGQRGLFGRGLRDVWLAQGGGRIEGVRGERSVESWFFPAPGDDPYAYLHIRDEPASRAALKALGVEVSGTRVTVPLAQPRLPAPGRLRALVAQLVQLRPILDDPTRTLHLELPDAIPELVSFPAPEPDSQRPILFDEEVAVAPDVTARIVVRRAAEPLSLGFSRATRRGGLVVRSGRAAHEATLAGYEGRPGTRHLYGEVHCEAIEQLQRAALDAPRPQLVVKVDRSGLNEHHPMVQRLYAAIDRVLRPIVADEERRAGAHLIGAPRAVTARDQVGLKALNEALRAAFDRPGTAGFERGAAAAGSPPVTETEPSPFMPSPGAPDSRDEAPGSDSALLFKQSPIRLHPGEKRTVTLVADPARIAPGTPVEIEADPGLAVTLRAETVPAAGARGYSAVAANVRARVTVEPGSRLTVLAAAGEYTCELEVVIVSHTASGWVRQIARKDEDAIIEAEFDPESGTVTVYEGRREFRELERAARRAGYTSKRAAEYVPFRMLEVEAAANAVYAWAAEQILGRRLRDERPTDPAEYASAVRLEAQALRHRAHARLMRAFLEPEIFDGAVRLGSETAPSRRRQLRLIDGDA